MRQCRLINHERIVVYVRKTATGRYLLTDSGSQEIDIWDGEKLLNWTKGRASITYKGELLRYDDFQQNEKATAEDLLTIALMPLPENQRWNEDLGWGGC